MSLEHRSLWRNKPGLSMRLLALASLLLFTSTLDASVERKSNDGTLSTTLRIDGSTTLNALVLRLAENFAVDNHTFSFALSESSSGQGFENLLNGKCDIAKMSRKIKSSELDAASDLDNPVRSFVLGYDAIVIIAHPSRSQHIPFLTKEQLHQIWVTQEITNWQQIGCDTSAPITVCGGPLKSGTREVFENYLSSQEPLGNHVNQSASTQDNLVEVSKDPNRLAFFPLSKVTPAVSIIPLKSDTQIFSSSTQLDKLKDNYPLMRSLQLVCTSPIDPKIASFLDFILRIEGQLIISEEGFIPIRHW